LIEKKVISLEKDLAQVDALRDQLRDKNIAIRDLNQLLGEKTSIIAKLAEKARAEVSGSGGSSSSTAAVHDSCQAIPDGKGASRSIVEGKPNEK